jgi:hypothetical protein
MNDLPPVDFCKRAAPPPFSADIGSAFGPSNDSAYIDIAADYRTPAMSAPAVAA